jgi:hypothetical protein
VFSGLSPSKHRANKQYTGLWRTGHKPDWLAAKESGLTTWQYKKTTRKQRLPGICPEKEFR